MCMWSTLHSGNAIVLTAANIVYGSREIRFIKSIKFNCCLRKLDTNDAQGKIMHYLRRVLEIKKVGYYNI